MTNLIFLVVVTAYCNEGPNGCEICCGRYAHANRTTSGVRPVEGRTVACNWLPFGTRVKIQGFNVPKVVEDRMSKKYNQRMDIFFGTRKGSHARAVEFGKRRLRVEVVR